jgi:hypothetical protein
MRHLRDARRLCNVIGQRFARTIKHQAGEATIKRFAAFFDGVTMVQMQHDRHGCVFRQMAHHFAQHGQRRVLATAWSGLQDYRRVFGFCGGYIGTHIFPPQADKTADGVAVFQGRLKDLGERCHSHRFGSFERTHLNLATMSRMPGMVCSCAAWVGWKY